MFAPKKDCGLSLCVDFCTLNAQTVKDRVPIPLAHLTHIALVLKILRVNCLTVKLTKCEFFAAKVEFLGHAVSATGIGMEPCKTRAITNWPLPSDIHELRSFIGLANYLEDLISLG